MEMNELKFWMIFFIMFQVLFFFINLIFNILVCSHRAFILKQIKLYVNKMQMTSIRTLHNGKKKLQTDIILFNYDEFSDHRTNTM